MAGKTYLQLVNLVLTNLREANVGTVSGNTNGFTLLVGQLIQQAKERVEDSWAWNALNTEIGFTTVLNQRDYIIDGTGSPAVTTSSNRYASERTKLLYDLDDNALAFDITNIAGGGYYQLTELARVDQLKFAYYADYNGTADPYMFSYTFENQIPTFRLARNPTSGRVLRCWFTVPQGELVNDSDTLIVPWRPVVSLATALALEERGEELGQGSSIYADRFNDELIRFQNLDAQKNELALINKEANGYPGSSIGMVR